VLGCGAVASGLVGLAVVSGTVTWDGAAPQARRPARVGPSETTGPPSTYPVVPAQAGVPPARYLQPVYALPSDAAPVEGRTEAILVEIGEVTAFFRAELDGAHPRYAPDGQAPRVITVVLPWSTSEVAASQELLDGLSSWLHDQAVIEPNAIPLIYVESSTDREACGWTLTFTDDIDRFGDRHDPALTARLRADLERRESIVIPLHRCSYYTPSRRSRWPQGGTHLLAHETAHALGGVDPKAPHFEEKRHTNDDPRDILYKGPEQNHTGTYVIDPGHDDYYRHGQDMSDIANSELLVRPPR
jgi:hypothetical protein